MKHFQLFVTATLLLLLGLTLGAEAIGTSSHTFICTAESSGLSSSTIASELVSNCDEAEHTEEKCADPCHVGQCHFGHCSFVSSSAAVSYVDFKSLTVKYALSELKVEGPILEGLRRPPRIS